MNDLVDTTEMYLRTIYDLEEEGVVPLRARIAERLDQSGPTVSQTVARMERDGLVRIAGDRHLELTDRGRQRAVSVMRKHRLAERLLLDIIGLPWEEVHAEACRWEHVMSEDVERRLVQVLDNPTVSPFGNPIPGLAMLGLTETRTAGSPAALVRLTELPAGGSVAVVVRQLTEHVQGDVALISKLKEAGGRTQCPGVGGNQPGGRRDNRRERPRERRTSRGDGSRREGRDGLDRPAGEALPRRKADAQPVGQAVARAGQLTNPVRPHARLQRGVEHSGHPVIGFSPKRRRQRDPRQRAVATRIRRKGQQNKRFHPPGLRKGAGQHSPQHLGLTSVDADGQRVQRVANRHVGQRTGQRSDLVVTEWNAPANPGGRADRSLHIPPTAAVGIGTPVGLPACRLGPEEVHQSSRPDRINRRDDALQVGTSLIEPAALEDGRRSQRRRTRIFDRACASATVNTVPAASAATRSTT